MKISFLIPLCAIWASSAAAQTAVYDTSIFKVGNTWVYDYSHKPVFNGTQSNDRNHNGTRAFTLLERSQAGDSIVLRVARKDSTTSIFVAQTFSDTLVSRSSDTARFVFRANAFSPSTPVFAKEHHFTGTEGVAIFQGDTLRQKRERPHASVCAGQGWRNIEGIGRVYDTDFARCGNSTTHTTYTLLTFNGVAFVDSSYVTGLRGARALAVPERPREALFHEGRLIYGADERFYDLQGKTTPAPRKTPAPR